MANSSIGRVIKIQDLQTGTGGKGEWKKREFVIETLDQYPKKVALEAWGDKTDHVDNLKLGMKIKVHFNPESREHNERWYTTLRVWKIEQESEDSQPVTQNNIDDESQDLPF